MNYLNEEFLEELYSTKFRTENMIHGLEHSNAFPDDGGKAEAVQDEHLRGKKEKLEFIERLLKLYLKPFLPIVFFFLSLAASGQCLNPEPKPSHFAFGTTNIFPKRATGFGLNAAFFKRALPGIYTGAGVEAIYIENSFKQTVQGSVVGNLSIIPFEDRTSPIVSGVAAYSTLQRWNFYTGGGVAWDLVKLTAGWGWYHVQEGEEGKAKVKKQIGGPMAQLTFLF